MSTAETWRTEAAEIRAELSALREQVSVVSAALDMHECQSG